MSSDFGEIGNLVVDTATLGATAGMRGAKAQGDIANAQLAQQQADRGLALKYAEATPEELAQLNRGIALNEADIARKQKLLDSSDPALIEAGKQALGLLRGEDAKVLQPLRNQFDQQEQTLRSKLQAQLGAGYENSTAGIQALEAFNQQKNNALASAQNQSLGQLLGVAQNTSANYGTQANIANAGTLGQLFGDINKRKVSAINGTPITGAGAEFVGQLQGARANQQLINTGINAAGTLAGMGAFTGGAGGGQVNAQVQPADNYNPYSLQA